MAESVILTETNNHTMTTASRKEKFINHVMSQIGTKILNYFHLSHFIHIYTNFNSVVDKNEATMTVTLLGKNHTNANEVESIL